MSRILNTLLRTSYWLVREILDLVSTALAEKVRDDERQHYDSDLIGELNHRTGRLDAGNDPYGWYDNN